MDGLSWIGWMEISVGTSSMSSAVLFNKLAKDKNTKSRLNNILLLFEGVELETIMIIRCHDLRKLPQKQYLDLP